MNHINVKIQKLYPDVNTPFYASEKAAGMDICAYFKNKEWAYGIGTDNIYYRLMPNETKLMPTGIKVAIPDGYEMQVRPRSGLSLKTKLRIANSPGTVDADYRGEVCIIMENISDCDIVITHGDRIAQLVFAPVVQANLEVVDSLDETARGEGGFGSTGSK